MNSQIRYLWATLGLIIALPTFAGSISGTVRDSTTGQGINAAVSVYNFEGQFLGFVFTNDEGQYLTDSGAGIENLETGTYFAKTFNFIGYFNHLYDDIDCTELNCPITSGTPIKVTQGQNTAGVDFALDGGGGRIRGRVTDGSGSPLPDSQTVIIYDEAGSGYSRTFDGGQGFVVSEGLPAGIYYAAAFSGSDVAPQLFGGRPCINAFCQPELGQPIVVQAGQTIDDVDFALQTGGMVSGTVTDEDNAGAPAVVGISLYNSDLGDDGVFGYVGTAISSADDGTYALLNVPPGNYFVSTGSFGGFDREIYDDIVCEGTCDPAVGSTVTVAGDEEVAGIDFALGSGGHIVTGTVADENGAGIGGITIEVFDSSAGLIGIGRTDRFGNYGITTGLPDGTYYLKASDLISRYIPELAGDIVCVSDCDPTSGQALTLSGGGGSSQTVDFELAKDRILKGVFEY